MANHYTIKTFSLSHRLVRDFIELPYQLHRQNKYWIAPLRLQAKDIFNAKHPFWKTTHCQFALVFDGPKVVGRVAAIWNKTQNPNSKIMHFGFYESIDNKQVANLLFSFLKTIASQNKCNQIMGPFNPSINYELGILSDGVNQFPKFMMPWSPSFYNNLFLQNGWKIEKKFLAYELSVKDFSFPEKMQRVKQYLHQRYKINFRNMNFSNLTAEVKLIETIYNEAFKSHWGYQNFPFEEIKITAGELKFIADRDLLFFVYLNEQPAGFIIAIPDLNEIIRDISNGRLFPFGWWKLLSNLKKIKQVRVLNAAVRNRYMNSGLGVLLYHELHQRMKAKGYDSGELSWVVEDNLSMNNALNKLGAKPIKTYHIYSTSLR